MAKNKEMCTGWRRLIGSPELQIIFHKRATKYRSLLQEMTYKDKGSYESSPPCTNTWYSARCVCVCECMCICVCVFLCAMWVYISWRHGRLCARTSVFKNQLQKGKQKQIQHKHTHTHANMSVFKNKSCLFAC